jgi:hypothetical protein
LCFLFFIFWFTHTKHTKTHPIVFMLYKTHLIIFSRPRHVSNIILHCVMLVVR